MRTGWGGWNVSVGVLLYTSHLGRSGTDTATGCDHHQLDPEDRDEDDQAAHCNVRSQSTEGWDGPEAQECYCCESDKVGADSGEGLQPIGEVSQFLLIGDIVIRLSPFAEFKEGAEVEGGSSGQVVGETSNDGPREHS